MSAILSDDARAAFDALAPAYDVLTADYEHDAWVDALLSLARRYGLIGRSALDVACGTGKSFLPLLARGYAVTACDVSEAMLERARAKVGAEVRLHVADMRALPVLGRFDLVTCLNDVVNYLLDPAEVVAALRAMRANLRPGGLLVFDVNTLTMLLGGVGAAWEVAGGEHRVVWRGLEAEPAAGGVSNLRIEVFTRTAASWRRVATQHHQRHYPVAEMAALVAWAGLELVGCHGQRPGAVIDPEADEAVHSKALLFARRPPLSAELREGGSR